MFSSVRIILASSNLRATVLVMICFGVTMASTLPLQSIIGVKELGLGDQFFALFMFVAAVVNVVASLIVGAISDTLRDRRTLVLLLSSLGVLGYGLIYFVPTQFMFVFAMLTLLPLARAAYGLAFSGIRRELEGRTAAEMTSVNSTARAMFNLAWILVPGLVGWWLAESASMTPAFLVAAIASLAMMLIYGLGYRAGPFAPPKSLSFFAALGLLTQKDVLLLVIAMSLGSGALSLSTALFPLVMTGPAGGTLRDVGTYAALLAALEIPFMLMWTWFAARTSISKALACAVVIYGVYGALMAFSSAPWHLYALLPINACGAAAILSLPVSAFQDILKDRPGFGTSLLPVTIFIGSIISSAGFALGTFVSGYSGTSLVVAAMCAAGAVGLIWLEQPNKRQVM